MSNTAVTSALTVLKLVREHQPVTVDKLATIAGLQPQSVRIYLNAMRALGIAEAKPRLTNGAANTNYWSECK